MKLEFTTDDGKDAIIVFPSVDRWLLDDIIRNMARRTVEIMDGADRWRGLIDEMWVNIGYKDESPVGGEVGVMRACISRAVDDDGALFYVSFRHVGLNREFIFERRPNATEYTLRCAPLGVNVPA